jgi:CubicO group peptidase (beta-lactamase class C family)
VGALDLVASWPGASRGVVVLAPSGRQEHGDLAAPLAWASLTKVAVSVVAVALAADGVIDLDDEAGPPGSTVRHLLSHASGLAPDEPRRLAAPGERRIYSNVGFEVLGAHLERWAGRPMAALLDDELFAPLGMQATRLEGSAASGLVGPTAELALLLGELMEPRRLAASWANEMRTVQFPGLAGVLPGVGRFDPCDWGLGLEVKGSKEPHWTSKATSVSAVGHFGRAGGFILFDPPRQLGVCTLGDAAFGPWALEAWPRFLKALDAEASGAAPAS